MHTVQTNMAKLCTQHSIFLVIMYNLLIFNCLCYEMAKELLKVNSSGFLILMCIQFLCIGFQKYLRTV